MTEPNILLIMPDQMRGDCLSLEDHPVLETPYIDRIGHEGMHFTRAYSTCPSCIAARRSLLTGQFPVTHGMVGYRGKVPLRAPSVAQVLRDAGYSTALAGRCMHQFPAHEPYGFERQVLGSTYVTDDDYAQYLNQQVPDLGGIHGIGLSCNGREARAWPVDDEWHPTVWTVRQACRLLSNDDGERPLFLTASFYAPHPPLFPPSRYMDHFLEMDLPPAARGDWVTPPPVTTYENNVDASRVALQAEELRRTQAGYFGLIKHIDDLLPELVEAFKAKSEREGRPWVIAFFSDHGEMLGDHHLFRKCEPYEGSARVPMLIQGSPELGFSVSATCASPVCLEDLMPTLLELAAAPVPDCIDGHSLVPVLRGDSRGVRRILHSEHAPCYDLEQGFHALTDGRMKYIWRPHDGGEQLFDLQADPMECRDLSALPECTNAVTDWRKRMIGQLKNRPEGFSDGARLLAGCDYSPVLPHALERGALGQNDERKNYFRGGKRDE